MSETTVQTQHVLHALYLGMLTEITFGQGISLLSCQQSADAVLPDFYRAADAGWVRNPSELATWVCQNVRGAVEVRVTTSIGPGAIARRIPKGV